MTKIEEFAKQFRLRVRRDECNDQVIQGRWGHLYFDGDMLCLMALDRKPAKRSKWEGLGDEFWTGDISLDDHGKRCQDVKVTGITNPKAAIKMAGVKTIRVCSEARRAVLEKLLEKARAALPRNSSEPAQQGLRLA